MTREEALKVAKPILFNTEMVRAIQDNRKTVTRRIIKPKFSNTEIVIKDGKAFESNGSPIMVEIIPHFRVGDILYVRETWAYVQYMVILSILLYTIISKNRVFLEHHQYSQSEAE